MKYFNFGRKGTEKEGVCTLAYTTVPSCDDLKGGSATNQMEFQRLGGDEDFYMIREGFEVDQEQQAFVVAMRLSDGKWVNARSRHASLWTVCQSSNLCPPAAP